MKSMGRLIDVKFDKLEKAKEIIRNVLPIATCGIFNTRNFVGDEMVTIYDECGLTIDVCFYYSYFEVFGLSDDEFTKLEKYYDALRS